MMSVKDTFAELSGYHVPSLVHEFDALDFSNQIAHDMSDIWRNVYRDTTIV